MDGFRAIARAAATLAEALHLPMAKGLRKAEQEMGAWVKKVNADLNRIDDEGVNIKLKSTFTPPKGFSMHSIVGQKGLRIPGYGGGDTSRRCSNPARRSSPRKPSASRRSRRGQRVNGIPGFRFGGVIPHANHSRRRGMRRTQQGIDSQVAGRPPPASNATTSCYSTRSGWPAAPAAGSGRWPSSGTSSPALADQRVPARGDHRHREPQLPRVRAGGRHPPPDGLFNLIRSTYGKNTKELIFSPAGGRQIHNGSPHMYTGITRANHWDHVHWAYDQGGWLPPGTSIATNRTGRPERVLGPNESAGGVNVTLHFHGPVIGSPDRFAAEVTPLIRSNLKKELRRDGKHNLANQL